jgi:hypothetical protein
MPRVQERKRWLLLPSAGVALIAWQGRESSSKTVAPNDRLGSWAPSEPAWMMMYRYAKSRTDED